MVKGETFSNQLFENEAFRHFINTFLNKESGVTKGCELVQTSSTISVGIGYFAIMGGFLREKTGTTLNLPSEAGYYKLVYEIDLSKVNTRAEFNQGEYKFIKSLGDYPSLIQEDLDDGGTVYQFEFCKFRITEGGITDYADTRAFLDFDNIYEEIRDVIDSIVDGSAFATKGTLLFEGSSRNVILNDSVANYDYIEIYDTVLKCHKIYSPNGRSVDLSFSQIAGSGASEKWRTFCSRCSISGTSINLTMGRFFDNDGYAQANDTFGIRRVIGYKL